MLRFSKRLAGRQGRRTGAPAAFVIARKVSPTWAEESKPRRGLIGAGRLTSADSGPMLRDSKPTPFSPRGVFPCPELRRAAEEPFVSRRQPLSGIAPSVDTSAPPSRRRGQLVPRRTIRSRAIQLLDRAARKGLIHRNAAGRYKGRLDTALGSRRRRTGTGNESGPRQSRGPLTFNRFVPPCFLLPASCFLFPRVTSSPSSPPHRSQLPARSDGSSFHIPGT